MPLIAIIGAHDVFRNFWIFTLTKISTNVTVLTLSLCYPRGNDIMRIVYCPVEDINISDIFYKIPKFLRTPWALIITTNGLSFLMAEPLGRL